MTAPRDIAALGRSGFFWRPLYQFGATLVLGLIFGSIGPFGTFYDLNTADRYAYWLIATLGGWVQVVAIGVLLDRFILPVARPFWLRAIVAATLGTILLSFEIPWLEAVFRPWNIGSMPPAWLLTLYNLPLTVGVSLAFSLAIARDRAAVAAAARARGGDPAPDREPAATAPVPFLRRVPPKLGQALLALEMEDHYLRIHTALGSDLVLCRLGDALAELEGCDGMQVHRSFWVARAAIAGHQRRNGRVTLTLTNGLEVPVSRTYLPVVREAGWLSEAA